MIRMLLDNALYANDSETKTSTDAIILFFFFNKSNIRLLGWVILFPLEKNQFSKM